MDNIPLPHMEMDEETLTEDRSLHFFYLPCGRKVVCVDTTAEKNVVSLTAQRDYVSLWPQSIHVETVTHLAASIVVKWITSEGEKQEVSFVLHHSFSNPNAVEWRLRLDAYLPLLEDALSNIPGLIKVQIERLSKEPSHSPFSPFSISSGKVNVEGRVFHISKELLAVHSQFFTTLFYGDFKERDQEIVELKDVFGLAFNSLLRILSTPHSEPTSVEEACELLELANRFEMLGVMKRCSKYLLSLTLDEDNPCLSRLLLLSETCRQLELRNHVLLSFKSATVLCDAFQDVAANLTQQTSAAVVQRMSDMFVPIKQFQPKVWLLDSFHGRVEFELFYDRVPNVAYTFARLFTHNTNEERKSTITKNYGGGFSVMPAWREEIAGHTPRKESGWLLHTNDAYSFKITEGDESSGHFFGKLINQETFIFTHSGCAIGTYGTYLD